MKIPEQLSVPPMPNVISHEEFLKMRHSEWKDELVECAKYIQENADIFIQDNQYDQKLTVTITITHDSMPCVEVTRNITPKRVLQK